MQNADVFGGFCRASSQQQTLQGGDVFHDKIRRAGGKRGLVMRAQVTAQVLTPAACPISISVVASPM